MFTGPIGVGGFGELDVHYTHRPAIVCPWLYAVVASFDLRNRARKLSGGGGEEKCITAVG